jgi:hypothetical protein
MPTLFTGGEKTGPLMVAAKPKTPLDSTADLRDAVASLVGGGYTGLNDDASKGNFARIAGIVGLKKAQDLAIHIFQQNNRPELKALKPIDRVSKFYEIPSSNIPTNETLQQLKSFGSGVRSGYTDSINSVNQAQQGNPLAAAIAKK